jgi:hypothetical protein
MLRMSPELHDALKAKAWEQGVSLNQWLVTVLAGTVSFQPAQTVWPGGATNAPGPAKGEVVSNDAGSTPGPEG